jgi:hypothetical protein
LPKISAHPKHLGFGLGLLASINKNDFFVF